MCVGVHAPDDFHIRVFDYIRDFDYISIIMLYK